MSRLNEREIARKLAEREDFEPPAGLLDKIKSEIPPTLTVGTEVPGTERRSPMASSQRWLIAASLVAMAGAGLVALQVQERSLFLPEEAVEAPAPEAKAAPPPSILNPAAPAAPQAKRKEMEASAQDAADTAASAPAERDQMAYSIPQPPPPPPSMTMATEMQSLKSEARLSRSDLPMQAAPVPEEVPVVEYGQQSRLGVPGGVVGGVVGGVAGGVVGGTPEGQDNPLYESNAPAPERAATVSQSELEKIPTAQGAVEGGVEGGVVGGVPGGVVGQGPGAPSKRAAQNEAGQPYSEVRFKSAGVNPFVDTAADRLSTFGLDVDTASYTVARRYLADGNLPDPKSVRVEEFVNFIDYGDAPPARGDFAIKAEGAPSPFTQGPRYRLLRFNIRGRVVDAAQRRPAVLTFVIDVSGSMDEENRLGWVKQSLSLLLDQLRPTDRIGLVVYGDQAKLLLEPTNDREAVRQAIDRLRPEGATNAEAGLLLGYEVAGRNFRLNAANRIILCSDGVANVGHAGPQAILGQIGREARRGIELSTLGFGMGNYNDNLMEQLADKGDGRYAYIDTLAEAKRVLVEEISGTLQTIAKDAKVQVEFNPAAVARYRLLGYENRAIADERFRDDKVDAGEVGAGHSVTALYEIELRPDAPAGARLASLHLRYRTPEVGNQTETIRHLSLSELAPSWEKASPGFRLSALVAQFAEILKQSPWAKGDLADVARQMREVSAALPKSTNARVSELADLVGKAARIKAGGVLEK
jgi:Ca-activated chloride channel family protein